jgi:hypothetical protein
MVPFKPPWYKGEISQYAFFEGDHWRIRAWVPNAFEIFDLVGIVSPEEYSTFDITVALKIDPAGYCVKWLCFNYSIGEECIYFLYTDELNYVDWCMYLPSYDFPGQWEMIAYIDGQPVVMEPWTDAFAINLEQPNEVRMKLGDEALTIYINGVQVFDKSRAEIEYEVNTSGPLYDAESNTWQPHIEFVPASFGVAIRNGVNPNFPYTNINVKVQLNAASQ